MYATRIANAKRLVYMILNLPNLHHIMQVPPRLRSMHPCQELVTRLTWHPFNCLRCHNMPTRPGTACRAKGTTLYILAGSVSLISTATRRGRTRTRPGQGPETHTHCSVLYPVWEEGQRTPRLAPLATTIHDGPSMHHLMPDAATHMRKAPEHHASGCCLMAILRLSPAS
jgi:hypothetical protein